jgi:thiamine thiazole synthase
MAPVAVPAKPTPALQPKVQQPVTPLAKDDIREDYDGSYKFAPITEAEVSRAMIKRQGNMSIYPEIIVDSQSTGKDTSIPCMNARSPTSSSSELAVLV